MKSLRCLTIALLIILPSIVFGQEKTNINGFMGIEFGNSKEQIISLMKTKGYTQKIPLEKNPTYDNVRFGAFNNCNVTFYFVNNKMYQGLIILPETIEGKVIGQYEDVSSELAKKYGEGNAYSSFKYPYEKGDGHELTAIKLGKADYNTFWSD